ncbi:uncharacterized protein LOC125522395 [Triticum urartu]|uniref:uncharacterized protein LOC125522395 n=1 Tax=Triticum urartu TaxID=4572 RepID=UPI0020446E61|nr:uncharacterized protein LOC125522395 [Triticum urartu]
MDGWANSSTHPPMDGATPPPTHGWDGWGDHAQNPSPSPTHGWGWDWGDDTAGSAPAPTYSSMDPPRSQRDPPPSLLSVGCGTPGACCGGRRRQQHLRRAARPRHSPRSNLFCLRPTMAMATRRLRTTCWTRRWTTLTPQHKTTMSMSPPEDACRDGQFQVMPRAQALLDAVSLPPQPMGERGIPEALKFSMAHD